MTTRHTRYGFQNCMGAFFQMDTANARALLPSHLEPIEAQHGRSVLAILAFQFTESEVGAYDEIVLAIITPPRVQPGVPLPKAAFFPFVVGTSTTASREHAMERWHLPHHPDTLDFAFDDDGDTIDLRVCGGGEEVLHLSVTAHAFRPVVNAYHAFTVDEHSGRPWKVNIRMDAPHSEHESERGRLALRPHEMLYGLDIAEVDPIPFREEWYRAGVQVFDELESLETS
ncbi:hypothetical protein V3331_06365 [Gaopeijia maritima]|uniref:hypothetical protein n=1 Tax=Gaopeijia maritima TaxID=3119007 RepID=UPI003246331A